VHGPIELSTLIANAPQTHSCYTKKWLTAAYRRSLTTEDTCLADTIAYRVTEGKGNYKVVDMIADLAQSPSLRYRVTEVAQ
jgi:hypothetical protein